MTSTLAPPRLSLPELVQRYQRNQPKKPRELDPHLARDLEHGWLFDYLAPLESMICGRWDYWAELHLTGKLPEHSIPELSFSGTHRDDAGRKMLTRCLNSISNDHLSGDGWMGWSSFENFTYLLDWLLFGFGHDGQRELPKEPTPGASMRLYQLFDLAPLLLWPYDHLGDMLAECRHGRHNGFFPTPHEVCEVMVLMVMQGSEMRDKTTCDPACGTGRMLLHAAQYSLRLYGQDIDATMCKASLVNGYLYAPWLARPIAWLDGATLRAGNTLRAEVGKPFNEPSPIGDWSYISKLVARMDGAEPVEPEQNQPEPDIPKPDTPEIAYLRARSDGMVDQAPPHIQTSLFDTEFDIEGTAETAPILKRRRIIQPSLFDDPTGDDHD